MKVIVTAPCGPADPQRLAAGVERLGRLGFEVKVHPQCAATARFTAGPDELRFAAFMEAANDPEADIVWCARGGYGATRLLPMLQEAPPPPPPPPPTPTPTPTPRRKTLVGYSDVTALHTFVADRWGWRTIHGPMPAAKQDLPESDWQATAAVIRGEPPAPVKLEVLNPLPEPVEATLVGGNLAVWNCLTGTPWQPMMLGRLLFLEDTHEEGYNLDRMVMQLSQAAGLGRVAALVLGSFTDGADEEDVREVFGPLGLPVYLNHPAGHGDRCPPLLLHHTHRLDPDGTLTCLPM